MARYKLNTYQFGIVSGIRQEISDRISSAMPGNLFAPEARKGQLFVLTEPVNVSGSGNDACALVAKTITEEYYKDRSFSITSSLRKAIVAANSKLYEYNFKAAHHQRTAVGLTCVVLRHNDLYLGQVQPTQAYIAHKGQLRALPAYPSWDPVAAAATSMLRPNALGTSLFSEPELYRNVVEPGDQVVLCSSRLAHLIGRGEAERLFCLVDTASALEELHELARRNSLNEAHLAMLELVPLLDSVAQRAPLSAEGVSERGKAAISVVGEWLSDVTSNAALTLRRTEPTPTVGPFNESEPAQDDDRLPASTGVQPTSALTETPALPAHLETIDPRDMVWLRERPRYRPKTHADIEIWPPSAFLGESTTTPALNAAIKSPVVDLTDQTPLPLDFAAIPQRDPLPAPSIWERLSWPLRRFFAIFITLFTSLGRKKRPAAQPIPRFERSRGLSYRREPRRHAPFVLIVLLCLMAGLSYVYLQYRTVQSNNLQFQEIIGLTQEHYVAALNAPDDALASVHLEDMQGALETLAVSDLLQNDPARLSRYRGLVKDAEDLQASINRTSLLDAADLETVLTMPISDTISKMLIIPQGTQTELYVVGLESGTIYRRLEGSPAEPEVVLQEGQTIEPVITAPMRSLVWRVDNLMAVDRAGFSTVYLRQPDGGWIAQTLPASEFWPDQPFPDIESFGGHLYVWQRGPEASGQIEKYTSGDFANLPTDWITDAPLDLNLPGAVDMSIDGDIYLLKPDGAIEVFNNGAHQRTIPAPTLDPPLVATRMFLSDVRANELDPNQGHFYLLDVVNQRIVEIDQQGTVLQQIRTSSTSPIQFDRLSDVAIGRVDAEGNWLYVANGEQIYKFRLPTPPPPRQDIPVPAPNAVTLTPTP